MAKKAKKGKGKDKKSIAKQVIVYHFHWTENGIRPFYKKIRSFHYESELQSNSLPFQEELNEALILSNINPHSIGVIDKCCNHPMVSDYVPFAKYNAHLKKLIYEPLKFITNEPKSKKKKKQNESLVYDVIAKVENTGTKVLSVTIHMNIYSHLFCAEREKHFGDNYMYNNQLSHHSKISNRSVSVDSTTNNSINHNDKTNKQSKTFHHKSSIVTPIKWHCAICTFDNNMKNTTCDMCYNPKPVTLDDSSQQNDDNKVNDNNKYRKKSIINDDSTENIEDLLDDSDDDYIKQPNNDNKVKKTVDDDTTAYSPPKKRRKLNVIDSGTINTINTNDTNINSKIKLYDNPNNDPTVTLNNMAIQHKWLVQQTHCMLVIEDLRLLLCKFAVIRDLYPSLGCKPIGILSGVGSKTSAKNWQKNYIAIKRCNENRKNNNLPEIDMPINNQRLLINKYLLDSFNKTASQMRNMISSPGDEWPVKTDDFIQEKDKTSLSKLIEKRYNIYTTFKQLQKIHGVVKK